MGYLVPSAKVIPGELDRDTPVSIHIQLRELFRNYVTGTESQQQLPSERDMAERFGVARMTLRHAVEALVEEGLLERIVGIGTFVARPKWT